MPVPARYWPTAQHSVDDAQVVALSWFVARAPTTFGEATMVQPLANTLIGRSTSRRAATIPPMERTAALPAPRWVMAGIVTRLRAWRAEFTRDESTLPTSA